MSIDPKLMILQESACQTLLKMGSASQERLKGLSFEVTSRN